MRLSRLIILLLAFLALSAQGQATEPPMRSDFRYIPGTEPTEWLRYQNSSATSVVVAGSWDAWTGRAPMVQSAEGIWTLDVRTLKAPFAQHDFKFIVDGDWEKGDNRALYVNEDGLLEKPSDLVFNATIDDRDGITVIFSRGVSETNLYGVRLEPSVPIQEWHLASPQEGAALQGYFITGGLITFLFDERAYGVTLSAQDRVTVAGNFNYWDSSGGGGRWQLRRKSGEPIWGLTTQLPGIRPPAGEKDLLFKFVINNNRWLPPPQGAMNAVSDGKGNVNLRIDPRSTGGTSLKITTDRPLDLSESYMVILDGVAERPVWAPVNPGEVLDKIYSEKELGAILDREQDATTYRIFAPRARSVHLCIYDTPEYEKHEPEYTRLDPIERYPMWEDKEDGVWEISLLGLDVGKYYSFNIDGPTGNGEAFNGLAQVGDPYALAAAHARNNCIVIDPDATNRWFGGWTDQDYVQTPIQDVVIYECHIRGMTMHPSSGVDPALRGKYVGLLDTVGTGTGLDHLKDIGVTTIELLPIAEFNGYTDVYSWGYAPVFYFAPEASYGRQPMKGSQFYEFKKLVDGLHEQDFGVIVDVVFNHVGGPNIFNLIDKKYYFRLNPDYTYSNFSGCGNDIRTEAPMMSRLIVDNILYWMEEFHVDGFRFDLAELIDMDTMMSICDAARAVNSNVLLISEPWSFRGENKQQLKGTCWSAWNNDFRYAAKGFAMGERNRDWLKQNIFGSINTWAETPLQPVNYLESHDDMALADEFCTRPDRDGRNLQPNDVAANRLATTILFTSLGIPMIHEGQEFLRSKWGIRNTFDKGDDVNAVRWGDRDRPLASQALDYYKGLIHLRQSPDGAAFRVTSRPPQDYYKWITPPDPQALGYIVNVPKIHEGAGFMVLLNANGTETSFDIEFPAGRWKMIGDGERLNPDGLPDAQLIEGPQSATIRVPGIRAFIFKDGF